MASITTVSGIALQANSDHIYEVSSNTNVAGSIDDETLKVFKIISGGKLKFTTGNNTTFDRCTFIEEDAATAYGGDNFDNGTGTTGPRFNGTSATVFKGCEFIVSDGIARTDWDVGVDSNVQFIKDDQGGFCYLVTYGTTAQANHFASNSMKIDGLIVDNQRGGGDFELRDGPYDISDLIVVDNDPGDSGRHVVVLMNLWSDNDIFDLHRLSARNVAAWGNDGGTNATRILRLIDPVTNIIKSADTAVSNASREGVLQILRTYQFSEVRDLSTQAKIDPDVVITAGSDDDVAFDKSTTDSAFSEILFQLEQGYDTLNKQIDSDYRRVLVLYGYQSRSRLLQVDWDGDSPLGIDERVLLMLPDTGITEQTEATAGAYSTLADGGRLYDRIRHFEVNRSDRHFAGDALVSDGGSVIDLKIRTLIIDGSAPSAFAYSKSAAVRDTVGTNVAMAQGGTITIGAGSDRLLLVAVGSQDTAAHRTVTGVTYGGVAMQRRSRNKIEDVDSSEFNTLDVWYLDDAGISAAAGTTISVTWDVTPTDTIVIRGAFNNVDQVRPFRATHTFYEDDDNRSTRTTVVPGMDEGRVVSFALSNSDSAHTWTGAATETTEIDGGSWRMSAADDAPTSDTATTMSQSSVANILSTHSLMPSGDQLTIDAGTTFAVTSKWTAIKGNVVVEDGTVIDDWTIDGDLTINNANNLSDVTVSGDLRINTGADSTLSFSNVTVTGNVYNDDASHTLTINSLLGSSLTAGDAGTGNGETSIVTTVPIKVIVKDIETNSLIQGARVFIKAEAGGDLPSGDSVSITRSGSVATVTHTAHGMINDEYVVIYGSDQREYRGTHQITYINANSYSYAVSGTPASPATGSITATAIIVDELTDASGEVNETLRYTSDQPVSGVVRKATV